MRIVIAGTGALGLAMLKPLLGSNHDVVAVLQNGRRKRSWFQRWMATSPWLGSISDATVGLAVTHRIPILWLDSMTPEALAPIRALQPDLIITCGFGIILKKSLLDLPTMGCINVHSSLLPRHRGPMPFSRVILDNDSESGVTIHVTEAGVDTGAILEQRTLALSQDDTAMSVYRNACVLAARMVLPVVDGIAKNGLAGTPQNEAEASYDPPLSSEDMTISWDSTAEEIHRVVRAGIYPNRARFVYKGREIHLLYTEMDVSPVDAVPGSVVQDDPLKIATGLGTITVLSAHSTCPVSWPWPAVWNAPRVGTVLSQ